MVLVKLLVTGSSGFIGAHAVRNLAARGYDVQGVDLQADRRSDRIDIADPTAVDRLFHRYRPDGVVHLAAMATVPGCELDPAGCLRANVLATVNIARAAGAHRARLVFASSAAVYGDLAPVPTPVATVAQPTNLYGISKLAGEGVVREYAPDSTCLRFFNVYGEGCRRSYVIPDLIRRLAARPRALEMSGTGKEARDFVYIADVISAIEAGVRGRFRGTYNVGTGIRTSLATLAREIARLMGQPTVPLRFTGTRPGDFRVNHADIRGRNRVPGWSPRTTLTAGLARTVAAG